MSRKAGGAYYDEEDYDDYDEDYDADHDEHDDTVTGNSKVGACTQACRCSRWGIFGEDWPAGCGYRTSGGTRQTLFTRLSA